MDELKANECVEREENGREKKVLLIGEQPDIELFAMLRGKRLRGCCP